ncbi:Rap1a/Tai family immunity protein [Bradyrhizobium sp. 195]|nr:hypothetical protein IVB26_20980 [Bradyrhizobium sp. 195]
MASQKYECAKPTKRVTNGQLSDIVMKFLREHPEDRHLPAVLLANRAYYVAFNCRPLDSVSSTPPR